MSTATNPLDRLRQQSRRGVVSTVPSTVPPAAVATLASAEDDFAALDQPGVATPRPAVAASVAEKKVVEVPAPVPPSTLRAAPTPGVFVTPPAPTPPASAPAAAQPKPDAVPVVVPGQSAQDRMKKMLKATQEAQVAKREMASVRALTRLLEAVFRKPGSSAPNDERITALRSLVVQADLVSQSVVSLFGHDHPSAYVLAQSMEAVVGLVGAAWERDDSVEWPDVIAEAGADPLIILAAENMGAAAYRYVDSPAAASERIGISMHASYWSVYMMGEDVDGITTELSSHVAQQIAHYVHSCQSGITDVDLHVAWMQGAIRRITDLFCAEVRARFTNQPAPTSAQIDEALKVAQEGFEGVEIHAAKLLEISRTGLFSPATVDTPTRPAG